MSGVCDNNEMEMLLQIIYLLFEHPRFDQNDFEKFVYLNRLQAENTPRTVNDTIAEQMQKLRVKDSPRLWKQDAKFYDAMNYDKMVSIYHDRFQDASDFILLSGRKYPTGRSTKTGGRNIWELSRPFTGIEKAVHMT